MVEEYEHILVRGFDQPRVERCAQCGIQHNPEQRAAARQLATIGQQWIIGKNGSDACDQSIRGMAQPVHLGKRFAASNPMR